jgi:hypothetical protein
MPEITLFDRLKYNCKTHPHDVQYNTEDPMLHIYYENVYEDAHWDTLRELVEYQGCSWEWYCEYYEKNPLDEKWGKW